MKKSSYIFMMIAIALILTACGKESKEDVINSIEENAGDVETYHTEATLKIAAFENDQVVDESEAVLNIDMVEDTVDSSGEMIQDGEKMNYYSTEDGTYVQMSGGSWEDLTAQEENFKQSDMVYESIAQIVIDLKDEEDFEMEEKDDTFVFTFQGKSQEVYDALEDPYQLSIAGAETKDVEHDLTVTVDSETYYVERLTNEMVVEVDNEKLEISIDHSYDTFNEIDAIEVPDEVVEEAEAATSGIFDEEEEEEEDEVNEDKDKEDEEKADETDTDNGDLEERVFEAEENGVTNTITYYYKGDKVITQEARNVLPFEIIGVESKEEAQEIFEPESEKFQGIEGLTHEMEYTDSEAIEVLEVNYDNLDFDAARGLPGMVFDGDAEKHGVSMERSAELLFGEGFVEKE